ncbi:hypothetical protein PHK61_31025 [Actinomycetospora lutea]|uniref:glycosyltransferase n=1 Tax=Actinomycetospora lutea TaxID=663604 RepID=UPI0023654BD0|nr:glycosyltransferase [Actinomycetospora lutea]MDD7942855.1 hypothetical protein [Actinomycetospora lutea]
MRTALPGGPERPTLGMLVKPAAVAVLRRLRGVRVRFLTDAFGVVGRRPGFPGVAPVRDPITATEETAVRTRGSGRSRVGVFGVISARKNVPELVRAASEIPALDVVLVGRCEPDVRAWLRTDPDAERLRTLGRLEVDDRFVDQSDFDAALRSVDVVAVLHDNDAPSGIVAEAGARGIPVLGPHRGWVSTVLQTTGAGLGVRAEDHAAVAEALRKLLDGREQYGAAARAAARDLGVDDFVRGMLEPDDAVDRR